MSCYSRRRDKLYSAEHLIGWMSHEKKKRMKSYNIKVRTSSKLFVSTDSLDNIKEHQEDARWRAELYNRSRHHFHVSQP